jgi:glycerol-3-phosphate acyltransferase PlsX
MRIGIDAMGGDLAPAVPVAGAVAAKDLIGPDGRLVLIGDEQAIRGQLKAHPGWESFIDIVHAGQIIAMDETPVEALRLKPDSSIVRMVELAHKGQVDAIISAGNTGACVAAAQMRLRRLPGVHRPGIAIIIPTFYGPVVMCDVGANVNCRPAHLHQYGIMSSEYIRAICNVAQPRVGLLSIGEEDAKGNALVKDTRAIFKADAAIKFIGNVEGRDIFRGVCDVVVCEGFVGNVCLKLMEGLAEGLFKSLLKEIATLKPELVAGIMGAGDSAATAGLLDLFKTIRGRFDFNEYGGAPLLGVNGVCIICHGASQQRAITNAVRVARDSAQMRINDRIIERIARCQEDAHE